MMENKQSKILNKIGLIITPTQWTNLVESSYEIHSNVATILPHVVIGRNVYRMILADVFHSFKVHGS